MLGKGVSVLKTETPLICGFFGRQKMGEVGQDLKKKNAVLTVSVILFVHTIRFCMLKASLEMDGTLDFDLYSLGGQFRAYKP